MRDNTTFKDFEVRNQTIITQYIGSDKIVKIPEGITAIDNFTFTNNNEIEEVILPDTVLSIGCSAFKGCTNLKKINLPSICTIHNNAFEESGLIEITLPNTMDEVPEYAFCDCTKLETVHLGPRIKTIGFAAFSGCKNLKNINLPEGLTTISEEAFWGCKINKITFPQSLVIIDRDAFCWCPFEELLFPPSLRRLEKHSFARCEQLKEIIFNFKRKKDFDVFHFGDAFWECKSLKNILLPGDMLKCILTPEITEYQKIITTFEDFNDLDTIITKNKSLKELNDVLNIIQEER